MFHTKYFKRLFILLVLTFACFGVFSVVYKSQKKHVFFARYVGVTRHNELHVSNVTSRITFLTMAADVEQNYRPDVKSISNRETVTAQVTSKPSSRCSVGLNNCVRVFNTSVDYSSAKQIHKCVDLRVQSLANTPICVYDPSIDIWVSKSIITQGNWEGDLIREVVNILRGDSQAVFLDLGCNVGVYTLAIAKFGRSVTALDANRENLEMLATSLQKGNLTGMVKLIWNALSDTPETVRFKEDKRNIGGLQMVSGVSNDSVISDENSSVAIVMDDLVPMFRNKSVFIKMDIETYELKAMLGGKKFFEEVDVKFLLMEWMHHTESEVGTGIIQFMTERGYTPYSPLLRSVPLKIENRKSWSGDIIWMKNVEKVTS